MDILLFKNTGTSALEVADLGIYLEATEELDILVNYRNEDIIESVDIETAMAGDGEVKLDQGSGEITLSYAQLIEYLTALTRYDTIDFAYIAGKDSITDITANELESLTDGTDINALHTHDTRYYTKTQLNNSNQGSVEIHWDNISNAPQFGAVNWKEPVDRSNASYGLGTVLPLTGNLLNDARMVADDGDGKPAQYVCIDVSGTWTDQWVKIADVDWGAANSISVTATGGISSTNVQSALQELQGDITNIINGTTDIFNSMDDSYDDGSIITVDNTDIDFQLADTKSFKVTAGGVEDILLVSASISGDSVEINGTLDVNGKAITLDAIAASYMTVTENNLTLSTTTSGNVIITSASEIILKDQFLTSAIPLSESGVSGLDNRYTSTSIIGAINEALDIASGNNTLDDAYDGITEDGAGRIINVDSGPVKLDATNATYAPLELTEQSTAPTAGLVAGQLAFIDGALYNYDGDRSKWLSVDEQHYDWADQAAKGKYLRVGHALGTGVGFKIPVNATITKVTARATGGDLTKQMQIRKNSSTTAIKTFSLIAGEYTSVNDDINISAGDYIQMYVSGGSGQPVKDPVISVYLRWRAGA